jgi:hypothetical protein
MDAEQTFPTEEELAAAKGLWIFQILAKAAIQLSGY